VKARIVHAASVPPLDDQPRKHGIWSTERMQAALWNLAPGQRIVAHCHPEADSLLTVYSGEGDYFVFEGEDPDPAVCYVSEPDSVVVPPAPGDPGPATAVPVRSGAVALTPAGRYYGLVNTGSEPLTALAVTAPDPSSSVYTVRIPEPVDRDARQ
jgi:oxalate decarboxylase/phosphoglucose isomerase-like protein (cupin superfamily)